MVVRVDEEESLLWELAYCSKCKEHGRMFYRSPRHAVIRCIVCGDEEDWAWLYVR